MGRRDIPKRALTAAAVAKLKPPASGQVDLFDTGYPGLALRLGAGGGRAWTYFYRAQGRQRRLGLGLYPAMSLAEAREAWRASRAAVEAGLDPAGEKADARRRQPDTVRSVGAQFIEKWHRPRHRTADEVARMLERHVYPEIGDREIGAVTRRDILDMLDRAEERGAVVRANRVLSKVRRLFGWAVERGIIEGFAGDRGQATCPEMARDRVLTDAELRAFWQACYDIGEPFGAMYRLLLLTGQRRDEVASAAWAELDLEAGWWTLPAARVKNKTAHMVALAPEALEILAAQPRDSALVFPARFARIKDGGARAASGHARAKKRLDGAMRARLGGDVAPWRLHDLRRCTATGMAVIGVAPHVVEAVLNHLSGSRAGVADIYNRHSYGPEKRAAAEAWARRLLAMVEGRTDNVVSMVAR